MVVKSLAIFLFLYTFVNGLPAVPKVKVAQIEENAEFDFGYNSLGINQDLDEFHEDFLPIEEHDQLKNKETKDLNDSHEDLFPIQEGEQLINEGNNDLDEPDEDFLPIQEVAQLKNEWNKEPGRIADENSEMQFGMKELEKKEEDLIIQNDIDEIDDANDKFPNELPINPEFVENQEVIDIDEKQPVAVAD